MRSIITGCLLLALSQIASAFESDRFEPWAQFKTVTKDKRYVFIQAQGVCTGGRISRIDDASVAILVDSNMPSQAAVTLTLERSKLIRITESGSEIDSIVYSGRSSWSDVMNVKLVGTESLLIQPVAGKASESKTLVAKANVSRVYYVRNQPFTLTPYQEYLIEEHAPYLDPRLWFKAAFLGKLRVLLYDVTEREVNGDVSCRP